LKKLIPILTVLFLFSCGEEKPPAKKEPLTEAHVEGMYKSMCGICHGVDGKLGAGGSKDLTLSEMTVDERAAIIKYGKATMLPFESRLSDQEIRALANYLDKFKP
jgi:mono/diheme cytochrome c family protein